MSPRTYAFLWILVFATAAGLWLAGLFSLLTLVVFGFIAFGMTFMGMMCVLPNVVAHPEPEKTAIPKPARAVSPRTKTSAKAHAGISVYRSV